MGAGDAPYLYDPPSRRQIAYPYSDFDPKAVTRASWVSAAESTYSKPKKEGPLIDFNQHPDSFMVVTPQAPRTPLPPNWKRNVIAWRWVQFGFRIAQVLGAIGLLLCVIFVRNTETAQGWIMRIPPAWDILVSTYGVYHLAFPAKRRTPNSSASYHVFGMIMDGGLIPLYVYTAWFAHQNWTAQPDSESRWTNIFNNDVASTDPLLFATFLVPTILGGLHLISIGIGIYLFMSFRKISNFPPDMNPFEDNLTSRKHQYKNSDASAMSMMQKPGYMSGSTLNVNDNRLSKHISQDRSMDFRNSRMNSDMDYSPHNPQSARLSRQQAEEQINMLQQSHRQSMAQSTRSRSINPDKRDMDSFSFVGDLASAPAPPPHTSQERSHSPRPGSSVSVRDHAMEHAQYAQTHDHEESQQKESLLSDNWFVRDDPNTMRDGDLGSHGPAPPTPTHRRTPNFSRPSPVSSPDPERQARFEPMLSPLPSDHQPQFMPEPLKMHPPTPPLDETDLSISARHDSFQEVPVQTYEKYPNHEEAIHHQPSHAEIDYEERQPLNHHDEHQYYQQTPSQSQSQQQEQDPNHLVARSHTNASAQSSNFAGSSVYSESAPELRTANPMTMTKPSNTNSNFQAHNLGHGHGQNSPRYQPGQSAAHLQVKSVGVPKFKQYGDLASAMSAIRQGEQGGAGAADLPPSPPKHGSRVVSRSGADITDEQLYVPQAEGGARRRYVSGKAAEEGMAGGRW